MIPYASLLISASQPPVLLAFTSAASTQRTKMNQLLEQALSVLTPALQIMCITETAHPEVVRSFGFITLPAFVLLQCGQELWRCAGAVDSVDLICQLKNQIEPTSLLKP